jgi:hypothetical protein
MQRTKQERECMHDVNTVVLSKLCILLRKEIMFKVTTLFIHLIVNIVQTVME